jgi:hypothetical protein
MPNQKRHRPSIGAFLGKSPELVYLHSGTKIGAAALGLSGKTIYPNELPPPFSRLTVAECEDLFVHLQGSLTRWNIQNTIETPLFPPLSREIDLSIGTGVVEVCGGIEST